MAVASPVHSLQTGAVRTAAIVGPEAVEVGHAHNDADTVAGTQDAGGTFLDFCADDIVFVRGLAIVAAVIYGRIISNSRPIFLQR